MSPVRNGLRPTPSMVTSEPGTMQRRDQRERGRGRVARHDDRRRGELGLALDGDALAAAFVRLGRSTVAPKWRSIRSVWSRVGCGSITVVAPGVLSPASSTADLTWAEGTGRR